MKEIKINTEFIKLDQFLKWAGIVGSGGNAKEMILAGNIKVNGEVVLQRGKKIYRGDNILIDKDEEFIVI